ncbi:MAG TPA: uroporphyrinogen decarboxylase family protein [Clostridia bacterium]|nr:uroporphyrinogen decarboxylase family protein [Clostridia bacterium]
MTEREKIIAVLNGEIIDEIPIYREGPMDVTVLSDLVPEDYESSPEKLMEYTSFFGNGSTWIGIDMEQETISRDEKHHTYRYETGAIWHESYDPVFCREALAYPVNEPEEALGFRFSDEGFTTRFDSIKAAEAIRRYKEAGYFVDGCAMGAFHAIYYYVASFENILTWMAVEEDAAMALFRETTRYSLESAKVLLDCGVDSIFVCSDLGSGQNLLFSREMFRKYVAPWLTELSSLCHERGAWLHLHSHGHIEDLMDDFIECGVDMINPIGPSDHNDLAMFKEKWGDRITFNAGIGTQIAGMTDEEMKEHIESVIKIGRKGGRFFPRTESGIPPMSREKTLRYIELLKVACRIGYVR